MMMKKEAQHWADYFAQDANEKHFESRRGVWYIEDLDCLLLYDNNPYSSDPTRRPREMRQIRKRLKAAGIETLACGGSRDDDDVEPYTVSLLLDCNSDRIEEVCDIAQEVVIGGYTQQIKAAQGQSE